MGLLDSKYRVVLSSFTNLAVDRVLIILVELGFHEFIRVGNSKSISKSLHGYACKSNDTFDKTDTDLKSKHKNTIENVFLIGE